MTQKIAPQQRNSFDPEVPIIIVPYAFGNI